MVVQKKKTTDTRKRTQRVNAKKCLNQSTGAQNAHITRQHATWCRNQNIQGGKRVVSRTCPGAVPELSRSVCVWYGICARLANMRFADDLLIIAKTKTKRVGIPDLSRSCPGAVPGCIARLTNLRFADNLMVTAKTKTKCVQMVNDVATTIGRVGLKIHPGKSRIVNNGIGRCCGTGQVKTISTTHFF